MTIARIPVEVHNAGMPSPAVNVWHARWEEGQASADNVLGALSAFYTTIMPQMANGSKVVFPQAVVDVETSEEIAVGNVPADIVGGASSSLEAAVAVVVSWKTSIRARRGRGRTFLGPIGNISGHGMRGPTEATRLVFQGAVDTLINASTGTNGWALGVYGQQNAGVETPRVLRDFTAGTVSNVHGLLRSRRD